MGHISAHNRYFYMSEIQEFVNKQSQNSSHIYTKFNTSLIYIIFIILKKKYIMVSQFHLQCIMGSSFHSQCIMEYASNSVNFLLLIRCAIPKLSVALNWAQLRKYLLKLNAKGLLPSLVNLLINLIKLGFVTKQKRKHLKKFQERRESTATWIWDVYTVTETNKIW